MTFDKQFLFVVPCVYLVLTILVPCCFGTTDIPDCTGMDCEDNRGYENENSDSSSSIEIISSHTPRPLPKPQALSMLAEDLMDTSMFIPTPLPTENKTIEDIIQNTFFHISPIPLNSTPAESNKSEMALVHHEEPKGRALNFSVGEKSNGLQNSSGARKEEFDLSDVTIRDDEDEDNDGMEEMFNAKILAPKGSISNVTLSGSCEKGGLTYENGEKLETGCDSICTCHNGKMDCKDRCAKPFFRKGKKILDPLCSSKDTEDPCCSVMVCAGDTETEPLEMCQYENKSYILGDKFNKGCSEVCTCEQAGRISCKPRCPPQKKTSERCVEFTDPQDSCCKKVLCDVTLEDHEHDKEKHKIVEAKYINSSAMILELEPKLEDGSELESLIVEVSDDKNSWNYYKLLQHGLLLVREPARYVRLEGTEDIVKVTNIPQENDKGSNAELSYDKDGCKYKGQTFKFGEEYNDECESLCVCRKDVGMKCLKMECPSYFGADVLDPNCVEWETVPPNFQPKKPDCCPEEIRCKNNGSCPYEGEMYKNWEQLPINVTGCDKRCYCEMGKVECQNSCPPVSAIPPNDIPCLPHEAIVTHIPGDDCCMYWECKNLINLQGGFSNNNFPGNYPGYQQPQDDIVVHTLEAVDAHTVRLAFMVPPVIVGLHGRVEVRYTHEDNDVDSWEQQVFAPPNDLIATPSLEFDLLDLRPNTEYKVKITVTLRDLHNAPTSRVYKIKTLKEIQTTTVAPAEIPIQPDLAISDINATWVVVTWRKFTEYELQFIDGVQLRYKEIDGKIYAATPLIHRAVTSYTLENLKPNAKYEIGIYFIPFAGQQTELHANNLLHFSTANEVDTYAFNVSLEIGLIKATSVEILWNGVPYPEDKYVNIYRAIYQSDTGKEDQNTFKVAKRDSPSKTIIMDLKPGTRYRLWLEVYLTNGKIKTSNVQDFLTKPRAAPPLGSTSTQDKLSRAEILDRGKGDYYGPLVIVGILASLAILSTLILLLILVRRHNQNKAAITPPSANRISQSAYDNPTYKVEIQQETMGL